MATTPEAKPARRSARGRLARFTVEVGDVAALDPPGGSTGRGALIVICAVFIRSKDQPDRLLTPDFDFAIKVQGPGARVQRSAKPLLLTGYGVKRRH